MALCGACSAATQARQTGRRDRVIYDLAGLAYFSFSLALPLLHSTRLGAAATTAADCCEGGLLDAIGVLVDGSLTMEYNDIELRQMKAVHVEVPSVPNFMDISMVD